MDVSIKQLDVAMQVKNKGVEFEVREPNGGKFLGDCVVTKTGLIWCPGKTDRKNGKKVSWKTFIALMEDD